MILAESTLAVSYSNYFALFLSFASTALNKQNVNFSLITD